jgi:tRNA pseudouridine55 synthase
VSVASLELVERDGPRLTFELEVSKGYYVRSFARDVGQALGVPAHLSALRRLASGPFDLDEAVAWPPADLPTLEPLARAASRCLPVVRLTASGAARASVGQPMGRDDFEDEPAPRGATMALVTRAGRVVALGREQSDDVFRVVRGFRLPDEP